MENEFWKNKSLEELTSEEWEAVCDRCGLCCLEKLEDEETGEIFYTNIACPLLDTKSCSCRDYENRNRIVKDCLTLGPFKPPGKKGRKKPVNPLGLLQIYLNRFYDRLRWLPPTCAYRLLAEGKDLPFWHPLISGNPDSAKTAGRSVQSIEVFFPEEPVDDYTPYIIENI
jgi:hypothetical protein